MADDLERASIADVSAESADGELPVDIDALLFGGRPTEAIVADLDGESLAEDAEQEATDGAPMSATVADPGLEPIGGYRAEWRPSGGADEVFDSNDLLASPDGGPQLIGGNRAEWHPSGEASDEVTDEVTDSFDPTDLRAGTAPPSDDGSHDMDIDYTGLEAEPTDVWLGPAELGDDPVSGVVTEVSDTYAEGVATDGPNFEDVD